MGGPEGVGDVDLGVLVDLVALEDFGQVSHHVLDFLDDVVRGGIAPHVLCTEGDLLGVLVGGGVDDRNFEASVLEDSLQLPNLQLQINDFLLSLQDLGT